MLSIPLKKTDMVKRSDFYPVATTGEDKGQQIGRKAFQREQLVPIVALLGIGLWVGGSLMYGGIFLREITVCSLLILGVLVMRSESQ